jgi:hypothetical protein
VGGYPIPEVNRLMHAFMAGAKETNPKVRFSVSFIGSWFDPPKAKEAAFAMIDKGADVLYAERFGVSDAAKEKGKLAIGNVINTQDKYPDTVVASALWNMEPTISLAIRNGDGKLVRTCLGGQPYPARPGRARAVRSCNPEVARSSSTRATGCRRPAFVMAVRRLIGADSPLPMRRRQLPPPTVRVAAPWHLLQPPTALGSNTLRVKQVL